ncbi:MAG: TolC family protein [Ignavibacteriales bacterium]|nr:TolC family protein [Ignavibacteriales bacterium]
MKNLSILLLLSFLVLESSSGQDSIQAMPLTLEKAIQLAMRQNTDLQTSRLDVEKADARVLEAWGYTLPSVDVSGQYIRTLKTPVFYISDSSGRPTPLRIGAAHSANALLQVRQLLFNGTVFAGVGAAGTYSDVARELFRSKQLETIVKVKKAFYGAMLAGEVRSMMHSNLSNAEENLKNVTLLRGQGILSEYDELRATVGVENLRPLIIQSETNYTLALDGLKSIVGLSPSEKTRLEGAMQFEAVDDSVVAQASSLILENNPGYNALKGQIFVNEAFVLAERSNYLPTIAAFGNYQYQAAKNTFSISTNDFFASSQVGLSFSWSLFQGLQTNARVQQAQVEVLKSVEQRTNVRRNLQIGLTATLGTLDAARKRIQAQEKTVEQADRGYKIVTARFLSNAATQLEVNDAQLALTQARVNRVQAIYDYLIAAAELDQLIGRLPSYVGQEID